MNEEKNYWQNWAERRMSRRAMLRRLGLGGLVVTGGSTIVACGQSQTPKAAESIPTPVKKEAGPKRGGTLKVGGDKTVNFNILDPHTFFHGNDETYMRIIFDYLVNYDDKLAYTPGLSLAESWEAVDDVTLRFKLRKGVKFTDGTEWNAQILKFNIDRIVNPETKSPRAYTFDPVKSIEYTDNYTAKMILKVPMASFLGDIAHAGLGMTTPANVAKWPLPELQRRPVGSGPFVLTESVPDDHQLLSRNKDYWRKDEKGEQLPYLDAVRFLAIPDATVRLANLRTGLIDMDMKTALKDVAKIKEDPDLNVIVQDGVSMSGMYWNLSRAPFKSLNFRRAVKYAINREAIVKIVTFGISKAYNGFVLPAHAWAFDPKRPIAPFDPVKAKQYLDQALAEGVKPEFTSYVPSGDPMKAAEMMQSDLAKIGIKMNIKPEEATTSSFRFWTSFEIDCFYSGYSMGPDPYTKIFVAHHSQGFYTPEKKNMGQGWDTPEGYYAKLDKAIDAVNRTYDSEKRKKLLYEASDILDDQLGYLGTFYTSIAMTVNKKVAGVTLGGDSKGRWDRAWLKE